MTYLQKLEFAIQSEKDSKHDFYHLTETYIKNGYSYKQLMDYLLDFERPDLDPPKVPINIISV